MGKFIFFFSLETFSSKQVFHQKRKSFLKKNRIVQGVYSQKRGRLSEWIAAFWLRLKGYRILARRTRFAQGEIDIILVHKKVIVFCEVKSRRTPLLAGEAISKNQQQRIARAAQAFVKRYPRYAEYGIRFDAVYICPGHWPIHVKGAWWER